MDALFSVPAIVDINCIITTRYATKTNKHYPQPSMQEDQAEHTQNMMLLYTRLLMGDSVIVAGLNRPRCSARLLYIETRLVCAVIRRLKRGVTHLSFHRPQSLMISKYYGRVASL